MNRNPGGVPRRGATNRANPRFSPSPAPLLQSAEGAVLVERTLNQLQVEATTKERAVELGRMGYIQWLGWLPGHASYEAEAVKVYLVAMDFIDTDPAVAVFCDLIRKSLKNPLVPMDLSLPKPRRKGGARRRRETL